CVVAPEHPILARLPSGGPDAERVASFRLKTAAARDAAGPGAEPAVKEGVDTGLKVRNPYSGETLALWTGNFVLMGYGTGAIMAVPAHDTRDFDFATRHGLAVRTVVQPAAGTAPASAGPGAAGAPGAAMTEDGTLVSSGRYDGLSSSAAREAMAK